MDTHLEYLLQREEGPPQLSALRVKEFLCNTEQTHINYLLQNVCWKFRNDKTHEALGSGPASPN